MLRLTVICLLAYVGGLVAVRQQRSLSEDLVALLSFKAQGENVQANTLESWVVGGNPCAAGFDETDQGFKHVMCCQSYSGSSGGGASGSSGAGCESVPQAVDGRHAISVRDEI